MGPLQLPQYTGCNRFGNTLLQGSWMILLMWFSPRQASPGHLSESIHLFIYLHFSSTIFIYLYLIQLYQLFYLNCSTNCSTLAMGRSSHSITCAAEERVTRTFFRAMMRVRRVPSLKNAEALRLIPEIHRAPAKFFQLLPANTSGEN